MINVKDFGALGNGVTDDTSAIQFAINSLGLNGGTVFIPQGTYALSRSILLRDHTTLTGAGMGTTILKIADNNNQRIVGLVRTPYGRGTKYVCVRDLTLDGNRDQQTEGEQVGFYCGVIPDQPTSDYDIACLRVEAHHFRGYGFDPHEVVTRLTLTDCVAHHNGSDGFTLDGVQNCVVTGCVAYENDRHGFNIVTTTRFTILRQNISRDNGGNGITIQNGSYSIHVSSNYTRQNAGDGIYCIDVDNNAIINNTVLENQNHGIRVRGGEQTTVIGNLVRGNSQRENNKYNEIMLDDTDVSGATGCLVANNNVFSRGSLRAQFGILETAGSREHPQADNAFLANRSVGAVTANMLMDGHNPLHDGNI